MVGRVGSTQCLARIIAGSGPNALAIREIKRRLAIARETPSASGAVTASPCGWAGSPGRRPGTPHRCGSGPQISAEVLNVITHRHGRDVQPQANVLVGQSESQQIQHLLFPGLEEDRLIIQGGGIQGGIAVMLAFTDRHQGITNGAGSKAGDIDDGVALHAAVDDRHGWLFNEDADLWLDPKLLQLRAKTEALISGNRGGEHHEHGITLAPTEIEHLGFGDAATLDIGDSLGMAKAGDQVRFDPGAGSADHRIGGKQAIDRKHSPLEVTRLHLKAQG